MFTHCRSFYLETIHQDDEHQDDKPATTQSWDQILRAVKEDRTGITSTKTKIAVWISQHSCVHMAKSRTSSVTLAISCNWTREAGRGTPQSPGPPSDAHCDGLSLSIVLTRFTLSAVSGRALLISLLPKSLKSLLDWPCCPAGNKTNHEWLKG